ncbi:MAG: DHHA1 domain-containing protein [Nitrososphaerales archaeon]
MPGKTRTVCVAHAQDVDGISSASLVKLATGADVFLANYDELIEILRSLNSETNLYVCDLGMNQSIIDDFVLETRRIVKGGGKVTYIDHHPLDGKTSKRIKAAGVHLVHSREECAGVLTYQHFRNELPRRAAFIACYAAVTDYLDNQPIAKQLIGSSDRQLILLESTMLSYAMSHERNRVSFSNRIVNAFQSLKFPHEIEGVPKLATRQAARMKDMLDLVEKEGVQLKNFAYFKSEKVTLGLVANLLLGIFAVPVAFAYRENSVSGMVEISLRERYDSEFELGEIVSKITKTLGGMGGGHTRASGARIPVEKMEKFLNLLGRELARDPKVKQKRRKALRRRAT